MAKRIRKAPKKKNLARRAYAKLENKVMAAVGRKAVRHGARTAKVISQKAAKAALVAGTIAAAKVLLDEVRARRRPT
jgi:hypothetical protein